MTSLDGIKSRARSDLVLKTEHGAPDLFLWEHADRVAASALRIAELLDIKKSNPDVEAVFAAALYHDVGWALRWRAGSISRWEILQSPCSASSREEAAALMRERLHELLPPESLKRAARAIVALADRSFDSIEDEILSDADNLDEFGLLSLWPGIRRGASEGKGVQATLDKWRAQKEYQYWTARLKDSFRLEPVRALARRRLEELEEFMAALAAQHAGDDISLALAQERSGRSAVPAGQ